MRDPSNWALPIARLFGVRVRVHALYLLTVFLWLRYLRELPAGTTILELFFFICLLPLPILLIHEWGHVAAARMLGGDSDNITLWPLGGLTTPHAPDALRSQLAVAFAGPIATLLTCLVLTSASVGSGYVPLIGLTANPITAPSRHTTTNRTHTIETKPTYYRPGTTEKVANPKLLEDGTAVDPENNELVLDSCTLPGSVVWLWRANWLSLWLVVCNLAVAAMPFDMGRVVHAIAQSRGEESFRASVAVARFSFLFYIPCFLLIGIIINETFLLILAAVLLISSARMVSQSIQHSSNDQEQDDSTFGYDFSQGYTSLEQSNAEDDAPPPEPKLSFWERRRKAKEMERVRKEAEQDQKDAERVDLLLDKIQKQGRQSLTDDERDFLERMSLRYRNPGS